MSGGLGVLVAIALLVGNALFVAAEFAAVSARREQLEPLARRRRRARRTIDAQTRLPLLLAGAQLGITLCSLGLGAVAEPAIAHLIEKPLHHVGLASAVTDPVAFALALILVVLAHLVLGEMVPKNVALAGPERAALLLVPALDGFVRVTRPVLLLLNGLADLALRLAGVQPQDELKSAYSADELAGVLAESRTEGTITAGEHDRLRRALGLQDRTAGDVLIPPADLVTVADGLPAEEIEALCGRTGFSRFPVAGPHGLRGYVHVKDLLSARGRYRVRPMPAIDAETPLPDVLTRLRRDRSHLATVVTGDRVLGALTLEDVIEELTGEIVDAANSS